MAIEPITPGRRKTPFSRVYLLIGGTIVLLGGVVFTAIRLSKPATPTKYLTAAVTQGSASMVDSATGEILPAQSDTVTVPQGAQIAQLQIHLGQTVSLGQTLATFSDPSLLTQLTTASASVLTNQSQVSLDTSSAYQNEQNAQIAQAQDNLSAAQDTLASDQASGQVTAPVSGVVTLLVSTGQTVSSGQTLAMLGGHPITAPMAGTVAAGAVRSGQSVAAGAVVLRLSSPALAAKILGDQSQVASLQAQLDKLQATQGQTAATIAQAKAQLQQSQQAYAAAQRAVSGLTVKAPYQGVITALNASAAAGGKLMTESSSSMVVTVPVPETEITQIQTGQSVNIALSALPGQSFTGTVSSIAPTGVYANGISNFPVTITVNNPASIRYGMSAQVNITVKTVHQALLVPLAALHFHGAHAMVEVLSGTKPQRVGVHVVLQNATVAAVRSHRLKAGEHVVTAVLSSPSGKLHLKAKGRALHHGKGGRAGRGGGKKGAGKP